MFEDPFTKAIKKKLSYVKIERSLDKNPQKPDRVIVGLLTSCLKRKNDICRHDF